MEFTDIAGVAAAVIPAEGPALATERDATDIIGALYGREVDLVVVPAVRLDASFFRLRTGVAGGFLQKFTNYRLRVAILGDIAAEIAASDALRDFVRESNRGRSVLFARDVGELVLMLGAGSR